MYQLDAKEMISRAGGMLPEQEIIESSSNLPEQTYKVGDKFQYQLKWRNPITAEIIGFAPSAARGRFDEWDEGKDEISFILQQSTGFSEEEIIISSRREILHILDNKIGVKNGTDNS